MKKILFLILVLSLIPLVTALDDCPDYRLEEHSTSKFFCKVGNSLPACSDAGENNTLCNAPNFGCPSELIDRIPNAAQEDYQCSRCNTEDGYRGRSPYCQKIGEEQENENDMDDLNAQAANMV